MAIKIVSVLLHAISVPKNGLARAGLFSFIADHWLTVLAIASISTGVFLASVIAGFIVLGLLLFAFEWKVSS